MNQIGLIKDGNVIKKVNTFTQKDVDQIIRIMVRLGDKTESKSTFKAIKWEGKNAVKEVAEDGSYGYTHTFLTNEEELAVVVV